MAERRLSFENTAGDVSLLLTREPRGHAGVVGVVLTEADRPDADAGMLFFTGAGSRPLSGHAAMAAAALALNHGLVTPRAARPAADRQRVWRSQSLGWPRATPSGVSGPRDSRDRPPRCCVATCASRRAGAPCVWTWRGQAARSSRLSRAKPRACRYRRATRLELRRFGARAHHDARRDADAYPAGSQPRQCQSPPAPLSGRPPPSTPTCDRSSCAATARSAGRPRSAALPRCQWCLPRWVSLRLAPCAGTKASPGPPGPPRRRRARTTSQRSRRSPLRQRCMRPARTSSSWKPATR